MSKPEIPSLPASYPPALTITSLHFAFGGLHVIVFFYLGDCNNPLGMANGDIPDGNIIASVASYQEDPTLFGAPRARMQSSSGYRADPKVLSQAIDEERSPFLLVTLPKEMVVTGIATQGLGQEWITKYTLYAADDTGDYKSIKVRRRYAPSTKLGTPFTPTSREFLLEYSNFRKIM